MASSVGIKHLKGNLKQGRWDVMLMNMKNTKAEPTLGFQGCCFFLLTLNMGQCSMVWIVAKGQLLSHLWLKIIVLSASDSWFQTEGYILSPWCSVSLSKIWNSISCLFKWKQWTTNTSVFSFSKGTVKTFINQIQWMLNTDSINSG